MHVAAYAVVFVLAFHLGLPPAAAQSPTQPAVQPSSYQNGLGLVAALQSIGSQLTPTSDLDASEGPLSTFLSRPRRTWLGQSASDVPQGNASSTPVLPLVNECSQLKDDAFAQISQAIKVCGDHDPSGCGLAGSTGLASP
ncbi:hypothetical protein HaLaN_07279 [Haematococcus lacustris]|uniref:Secreted protein n=1 Tax=Haematococcus lacustris TaxID=44745 RepID=A0A699YQ81_HAELA|nr:hypothetical protein HaLaN_07279 [Haematococcus lacustris]